MPMEVIFTDEDLEPVPEAAKFKPEKPAKSGASSLNAPKAAVKADERARSRFSAIWRMRSGSNRCLRRRPGLSARRPQSFLTG